MEGAKVTGEYETVIRNGYMVNGLPRFGFDDLRLGFEQALRKISY